MPGGEQVIELNATAVNQFDSRVHSKNGPSSRISVAQNHKVVVRMCSGFQCNNAITTHRVRQNVNGHREYCSLVCYSRWSPAMRQVVSRFPDYDQSPHGLEALINTLKREQGVSGAARTLSISRSTVSYWLRKLEFFRQFAGQSPDEILLILAKTADADGIDRAAKLIAVDPKTLQRAIDKIPEGVR